LAIGLSISLQHLCLTETIETLKAALAGRYTLEKELGRGGMAAVYLARDLKHDRPVALKVLHAELAATLGSERFLREIGLAARLQHPHILTVLDSGEAAGRLWFTMPYVEGESLRDRLLREKQLPVGDAVQITTETAAALDFAHRHGVVHRDIKPENILLCEGQALVADFGIAKALDAVGGENLTESGLSLGTPAYMSPEQAASERVDARSDVYALGCVAYEMLAGMPPFTGPTAQAILARHVVDPVSPLRTVRSTVPEPLERAIERALAKVPADRFQTAAEFAHALAAQMAPTHVLAGAAAPPLRLSGRALTLAGVVLALLAAVAVVAVRGRDHKGRSLDPGLVAVAPFDVLHPGLGLWREGLVDLLARNLDGAGPLRTVSPTVVVRRWSGRADRTSATALARSLGAGLTLYGTLVGRGQDSVRLTASVLDVVHDEVVSETELRGTTEGIDELVDTLTVRVLRDLAQIRPIGAARSSGVGSRSLPALRSFLRGEQFFRRTEWDSARTSYERAITLDSAFALAYWRLGTVRAWQFSTGDTLGHLYSQRAAALNQGLPPRESLLIVCDSLMSIINLGQLPDSGTRANVQRLFSTADRVTTRYPSDPEAWVALGEARYHMGPGFGVSDAMKLEAFDRAVTLDSAYAPAYIHAVGLALSLNDQAAARRYAARYLALHPGGAAALSVRLTNQLLDPAVPALTIKRALDTASASVLESAWLDFMVAPDSAEVAIALVRGLSERRVTEEVWYRDSSARYGLLASALAYRGHLREAARVVAGHPKLAEWYHFAELALAGTIPADTADAFYRRRLNRDPFWSFTDPLEEGLVMAPSWWGARGDSASLKRFLVRVNDRAQSNTSQSGPDDVPYLAAVGEAYLALARDDTAAALSRFIALPDSIGGPVWLERLTLARLLAAQGRERQALAVLDGEFPFPLPSGSTGIWALEHARLAEKVGEREKAKYWYGYVADLWRRSDPELQTSVAEAREALRRLTDESSR
jgi:eukaryotic-like serine/threonine-protein kinase